MPMCRKVPNLRRPPTNLTVIVLVAVRDVSVPLGPDASSGCSACCLCSPPQHCHTCCFWGKWRPHNNIRWLWQYLKSTSRSNLTLTCHRGFLSLKATHTFTFSFISFSCLFLPFERKHGVGEGEERGASPWMSHCEVTHTVFILLLNRRRLWMQFKGEKYAQEKGFWLKTRKKNTSSMISNTSEGGRSWQCYNKVAEQTKSGSRNDGC